jgi:predicted dienelactone hydrolase
VSVRRRIPAAISLATALALLGACSGGSRRSATTTRAPTSTLAPIAVRPAYAKPGPDVVAITTLKVSGRLIEVFYPARHGSDAGQDPASYDIRETLHDPTGKPLKFDPEQLVTLPAFRDLPPAPGRFPVVLFSHAYGGAPLVSATLEADLAAWGFIVIAPDQRGRDTLALQQSRASVDDGRDARDLRAAMTSVMASPLVGASLDQSRVAAVGYAQGGATALAALSLPEVDAAVAWASVAPAGPVVAKPTMLIGARTDLQYGADVQQRIYSALTGPKRLVLLGDGAGHATFTDQCASLWANGVLPPAGDVKSGDTLIDQSQNGCYPDEIDPRLTWPVIVHFTVAFLRSVFGIDPAPVGLGDAIASAFPTVPLTSVHQP